MEFDPGSIMQVALIIILIIVNAFFASAEMAIVSVNKNKISTLAEKGRKDAIKLMNILKDSTSFLSTIQVGITLAGFLSSAFASTTLSAPLEAVFTNLGMPRNSANTLAIVLITIILAFFTLVFGELIPKRVALQNSEKIALKSVGIISVVSKFTAPFVKVLSWSTKFFMKIFGINTENIEEQVTAEEINSLLEVGKKHGLINDTEKDMIDSIITFDNKIAKDVMTPRKNMFFMDIDTPLSEYYDEYFDMMYSRVPVFEDDSDNVIGILYLKDLMHKAYEVGFEDINIREILQDAYFTSERKPIDILFKDLQENQKHIAILVDEYGGVSGMVTIEDVIEEIVGEIEDEYDQNDDIQQLSDDTYLVKGYVSIIDLNEALDLELDENAEEYDTIAGLIINELGDLPDNIEDKDVTFENLDLHIEILDDNRIDLVKVTVHPIHHEDEENNEQESA
ncbi:hemolysin family protein [Mycoplasma sp. P36-A1]|uniref:hemolysin family protein n=1 Tax=Mycoplasma sp. P36-A1 TaxID=3252900 RepID=UPI003C2E3FFF